MTDPTAITLSTPDDWHVHFRDGAVLRQIARYTARRMGRAIVMPNLVPPVVTTADAAAYRQRIMDAVSDHLSFRPLMTAYLTETTDPVDIRTGFREGVLTAVKLYPAGATTNSASGVTDTTRVEPVLAVMAEIGMPLLVHGEVTDAEVDVFDREAVFIDRVLRPLVDRLPDLKIVMEHITTAEAVSFVQSTGPNIAATITPQHLLLNRNALFQGGVRPHHFCLPILKRERHRLALRRFATGGSTKVFLGTDSAPHPRSAKEAACGCAGCFTALNALELYAEVFEEERALENLEAFASRNGPAFYGLPVNSGTVTLERVEASIPDIVEGEEPIVPFRAGGHVRWRIVD